MKHAEPDRCWPLLSTRLKYIKVAGARHGALQPAKRFTDRMVYRSVIGPYFGKVLNWSVSCPMFLVRCRPHDPWMVSKQPCLSHRQGKTRIPESSEVGSNRQVDWMDKRSRGAISFAVLDIQDGGNENIQEASNSCPRQIASPSRTSGRKDQRKSIAIYNGQGR